MDAGRPRLYAIAREHYGLELNPGPFEFNSRPALIGAKYAEKMGVGPAYHAAVMRAYWVDAQRIDELETLADLAEGVGLDRVGFLVALQQPPYQQQVLDDVARAHAYGINGVPAMVFVDKYLVSGAQPYEVLVQVLEQVMREK